MSDDLIRRSDAIKAINPSFWTGLAKKIEAIPSVEPKRGEWKRRIVDNGFNADWVCSECGYRVKTDFVDYNFCPNCGAKMGEREGE